MGRDRYLGFGPSYPNQLKKFVHRFLEGFLKSLPHRITLSGKETHLTSTTWCVGHCHTRSTIGVHSTFKSFTHSIAVITTELVLDGSSSSSRLRQNYHLPFKFDILLNHFQLSFPRSWHCSLLSFVPESSSFVKKRVRSIIISWWNV